MSDRINARLDPVLAGKVAELRKLTGKSASDIIKAALEAYYEHTKESSAVSPMQAFMDAGFVACGESDQDDSVNYKELLLQSVHSKL
jgi:predicted GNAT family N-acyltransferase